MRSEMKLLCSVCLLLQLLIVVLGANKDNTHKWQQMGYYWPIPNDAVIGGLDPSGVQLFVGRAEHNGTIYTAKIPLESGQAFIAVEENEIVKNNYDILTGSGFTWVDSMDGKWVQNAVSPGTSPSRQPTYVCRTTSFGGILLGTMTYSTKVCNVSHNGKTQSHKGYQVMVKN